MGRKIIVLALLLFFAKPALANVVGTVDYKEIVDNYSKAKTAISQIDDRAVELQRYLLDKEKEFKKIENPIKQRAFEEATAKEFAKKQQAYANFKLQKEEAIDKDIEKAIKAVAIENKIDTVADYRTIYYGGVDITDKVIKKLNLSK
ncbi:OmpH family outer membrane protein [bacterium]|nr:OmpH family outer membrane protein [bacterium]